MKCRNENHPESPLQSIKKLVEITYLGWVVQSNGDIDMNATHRIRAGLTKWSQARVILWDKRLPNQLKRKFYCALVRPVPLYGWECCTSIFKMSQEHRMQIAETRMLLYMSGIGGLERLRSIDLTLPPQDKDSVWVSQANWSTEQTNCWPEQKSLLQNTESHQFIII